MTMNTDSWWRDIPDGVLAQDQQQTQAQQWGDNARLELAQQWGDNALQELALNHPDLSAAAPPPVASSPPLPPQPDAQSQPSTSAPAAASAPTLSDQPQISAGDQGDFDTHVQNARAAVGNPLPAPNAPVTAPLTAPDSSSTSSPTAPVTAPLQAPQTDSSGMLDRNGVIAYVQQHAPDLGLDPAAVLAVANQEGLNTAPGSHWQLKGENNISFGPPSWFGSGAGSSILAQHGDDAARWSWTPAGIDYWLSQVAPAAKGLKGQRAIAAIVNGFERPREDLAAGEVRKAAAQYDTFTQPVNATSPVAASVGAPDLSTQTAVQPTQPTSAQTSQAPVIDFSKLVQDARNAVGGAVSAIGDTFNQAGQAASQDQNPQVVSPQQAAQNGGAAVQDFAQNGPIGATRNALQSATSYVTSGQAKNDLGNTLISQADQQPLGPAIPAPIQSAVLNFAGNTVKSPTILDNVQTVSELANKYATPDNPIPNPDDMTPEDRAKWQQATIAVGGLAAGGGATETPYQSVMPAGTFEEPAAPAASVSNKLEAARTALVRAFTDRGVDLSQAQQTYQRALGRPLNAGEMASELSRLSADPATEVKIDEGLKPAIQAVGDDYNALRDYVTLRSNVDVANATANKVQEVGLARDVPSSLSSDLNSANTSLRMRQQTLNNIQNQSVQDPVALRLAQRRVNQAQRLVQRRQDAIQNWQNANLHQAATEGANAAERRAFSGGMTVADSQQALQDLEQQLGPQRLQRVQQAADQVNQFNQSLRQRLVDSGVMTQDQADQLDAMYPNWAKTRILSYMDDPAGGQQAGTKIGLSDRGLRQYTIEGTVKAREDPIASTVNYAYQVERMAMKNEAFNALRTIDAASPNPQLRQVSQDFSPTRNQVTMTGFVDGQKVKYVTDNKALGNAINGAGIVALPEWTTAWQRFVRATATSRNPVFLAGNAALDIPEYVMRTAIREGGPQSIPRVLGALAQGYANAFQGLLQGEYHGATAEFLKSGGGQSGYFTGGEGMTRQTVADLRRPNVFTINSTSDLTRLLKDLVTLKPVEGLGERVELGPRVAAYNLARARGANNVQATIEGRTVTVDFAQGGTVTKFLNQFIPFFNVGFQGPAQVARAFRDNPKAFVATAGSLIGLPTIASEVWNNSDPQRAQDYADVPQYLKDQGIVVMLPGDAAVDAQGNRKPAYVWINARNWAPLVVAARQAVDTVAGTNPQTWQQFMGSAAQGALPITATSAGDLGSRFQLAMPGVGAAMQLGLNKDFFRNRDIVTNRNDQQASATAKALTPIVQAIVQQFAPNAEVHPSAIEFAIRDQLAGVGGAALGAGDMLLGAPRQDTSAQSLPVVGGIVNRFVKNAGGEQLQQARSATITPEARQILRSNGITLEPGPVSSKINGIPLKQDEEARYQELANQYIDQAIRRLGNSTSFASKTQVGKESLVSGAIQAARDKAGIEVLKTIPAAEKQRRLRAGATAP